MFRYYTRRNCFVECASIIEHEICNCSQMKIPRTPNIRICNASEYICQNNTHLLIEKNIYNKNPTKNYRECLCLPLCNQIEYDLNILSLKEEEMNIMSNERKM